MYLYVEFRLEAREKNVRDRINCSKGVCVLISRIYEHVTLPGEGEFAGVIEVLNLEMERLP